MPAPAPFALQLKKGTKAGPVTCAWPWPWRWTFAKSSKTPISTWPALSGTTPLSPWPCLHVSQRPRRAHLPNQAGDPPKQSASVDPHLPCGFPVAQFSLASSSMKSRPPAEANAIAIPTCLDSQRVRATIRRRRAPHPTMGPCLQLNHVLLIFGLYGISSLWRWSHGTRPSPHLIASSSFCAAFMRL